MAEGWSERGLPHKGWVWLSVDDLEEVIGACEMCGTPLRYVHWLEHPRWPDPIGVGCVCAEHLTEDYVKPEAGERALRGRVASHKRILNLKWVTNEKGNLVLKYRGTRITVYRIAKQPYADKWGFFVGDNRGPRVYESSAEAQIASVEVAKDLKARQQE